MLPRNFFMSLLLSSFIFTTHSSYTQIQCVEHQKMLLLQFKNELIFNSSISTKLVQWNERDDECCKWYGVDCDAAGHVVSLQLDFEGISGGIGDSSSLFRLEYLEKLNLAFNNFKSTPIPRGIHNLTYLTHMNLSSAHFGGQLPAEISSLMRLVSLDMSDIFTLEMENLEMLVQNLTGLRELYLDFVNITSSDDRRKWSHIISSYLPNLTSLSLSYCDLSGPLSNSFWQLHSLSTLRLDGNNLSIAIPADLFTNFPILSTLSLRGCQLKGSIPSTFAKLTKLIYVDLSYNLLNGLIPSTFANLTKLIYVGLSFNSLTGSIPSTFANLTRLIHVDLSVNSLTGSLPSTLANLTKLMHVDFSSNLLNGSISSMLFEGLSNLVSLDLSWNSFSGNVPDSLFRLRSLVELYLGSNQFNGTFQLDKLQSLASLAYLDLSYNNLSVDVSNVTYGFPQLKHLDLVSCNLSDFPEFIKHSDMISFVDLSNNRIAGEIPSWIWRAQLQFLDLSFNLLTYLQKPYHIPASLGFLNLNSNKLRGELHLPIPPASQISQLLFFNNSLSGSIPTSLYRAIKLDVLDLSYNNISGSIPDNFPEDCSLVILDLSNNGLEGKIPESLKSCRLLRLMNVGKNNIYDSFPCMLSPALRILVLHSNRFHGEVTCHKSWPELQIVDISSNFLGGSLESFNFSNWMAMSLGTDARFRQHVIFPDGYYSLVRSSVKLTIKGQTLEYNKIWSNFSTMDFSCNNFTGEIPNATGDLSLLRNLNFSHNALNGSIPKSFGRLSKLESLDLSSNQLIDGIPVELGGLTSLSFLNLSYNKLVGEIPNSRQLETFSADSFKGNPRLCGLINLNISCTQDVPPLENENVEEKGEIEWGYVSAALGFVMGIGSIVWLLLFCRSFRDKYFDKIEEVVEEILDRRKRRRRNARRVARERGRRQ